MQLVVDNLVKKDCLPWNGILLLVTVQKKIIAPPRIVLLQNSSKFLALHHFDIAILSEYVSKSTVLHTQHFSRTEIGTKPARTPCSNI